MLWLLNLPFYLKNMNFGSGMNIFLPNSFHDKKTFFKISINCTKFKNLHQTFHIIEILTVFCVHLQLFYDFNSKEIEMKMPTHKCKCGFPVIESVFEFILIRNS